MLNDIQYQGDGRMEAYSLKTVSNKEYLVQVLRYTIEFPLTDTFHKRSCPLYGYSNPGTSLYMHTVIVSRIGYLCGHILVVTFFFK